MNACWNQLHPEPRISYYLFLRRKYGYSARQALELVKQTDAMIIGIQLDGLRAGSLVSATSFGRALEHVRSFVQTVKAWLEHGRWSRRRDDVVPG
jgi:hypothetical protein